MIDQYNLPAPSRVYNNFVLRLKHLEARGAITRKERQRRMATWTDANLRRMGGRRTQLEIC